METVQRLVFRVLVAKNARIESSEPDSGLSRGTFYTVEDIMRARPLDEDMVRAHTHGELCS